MHDADTDTDSDNIIVHCKRNFLNCWNWIEWLEAGMNDFDSGGCKNSQLHSIFLFWIIKLVFCAVHVFRHWAEKTKTHMEKTKTRFHLLNLQKYFVNCSSISSYLYKLSESQSLSDIDSTYTYYYYWMLLPPLPFLNRDQYCHLYLLLWQRLCVCNLSELNKVEWPNNDGQTRQCNTFPGHWSDITFCDINWYLNCTWVSL